MKRSREQVEEMPDQMMADLFGKQIQMRERVQRTVKIIQRRINTADATWIQQVPHQQMQVSYQQVPHQQMQVSYQQVPHQQMQVSYQQVPHQQMQVSYQQVLHQEMPYQVPYQQVPSTFIFNSGRPGPIQIQNNNAECTSQQATQSSLPELLSALDLLPIDESNNLFKKNISDLLDGIELNINSTASENLMGVLASL